MHSGIDGIDGFFFAQTIKKNKVIKFACCRFVLLPIFVFCRFVFRQFLEFPRAICRRHNDAYVYA